MCGLKRMTPDRNQPDELSEEEIRDIMEQLSVSREEAIAWKQNFVRKYHADRELVYEFLLTHTPRVREMEKTSPIKVALTVSREKCRCHCRRQRRTSWSETC